MHLIEKTVLVEHIICKCSHTSIICFYKNPQLHVQLEDFYTLVYEMHLVYVCFGKHHCMINRLHPKQYIVCGNEDILHLSESQFHKHIWKKLYHSGALTIFRCDSLCNVLHKYIAKYGFHQDFFIQVLSLLCMRPLCASGTIIWDIPHCFLL